MSGSSDFIRVGRVEIALGTAMGWVADYTDTERNQTSYAPYAYPAYDRFDGGSDRPDKLTDGDLLAPTLLNVPVKIRSFYALKAAKPRLEQALGNELLARDLASLSDGEVRESVAPLYEILDEEPMWNVQATTLSKILHRKRPASVVLHDRWVRECYLGSPAVLRATNRSWAEYMVLISLAIRDDLSDHEDQFNKLATSSGEAATLSPVRLLDILAWRSKGSSPT